MDRKALEWKQAISNTPDFLMNSYTRHNNIGKISDTYLKLHMAIVIPHVVKMYSE